MKRSGLAAATSLLSPLLRVGGAVRLTLRDCGGFQTGWVPRAELPLRLPVCAGQTPLPLTFELAALGTPDPQIVGLAEDADAESSDAQRDNNRLLGALPTRLFANGFQ